MEKFSQPMYSEVKTERVSDFETSFKIQPLEQGYANTLGNAVRRVLLSSVSGVAVFATKIANVAHEFETIKGVEEDIVGIILNLKKLKFIYDSKIIKDDEIFTIALKKKSSGEVCARNLELPLGIEIVDQSQVIARVGKPGALELELFIRSGRGYVSFEKNKDFVKQISNKIETKLTTGNIIAIDSDFSPVKKVYYETRELNTSAPIIQEELKIFVKTDGSIEAKHALAQAAKILNNHLNVFENIAELDKDEIFEIENKKDEHSKSLSLKLSTLDLSARPYNSLRRVDKNTIGDLAALTIRELENIKNLGKKSIEEIVDKLREYEITLKNDRE